MADARAQVQLAWVSIGLRTAEPDFPGLTKTLDEVTASLEGRLQPHHTAQIALLRSEIAVHANEAEAAWALAEQALDSGLLDTNDQLRCRLLLARAAALTEDTARLERAYQELGSLLDQIGADTVDPVMWREVARFALRGT